MAEEDRGPGAWLRTVRTWTGTLVWEDNMWFSRERRRSVEKVFGSVVEH